MIPRSLMNLFDDLKDNFIYFIEDVPNEYIRDIKEFHKLVKKKYPNLSIYYENQISVLTKEK